MVNNLNFIAHAFAGISPNETPWVAGFPGDVAAAPHNVWFGAPAIPLPVFIQERNNNYVCISTFKRNDEGQYRRRKDCWAGLWLVMFDDIGTKIKKKVLLEPSSMVETSPRNHQVWFFLKSPERDYARAEALITGLLNAGASDPGAGNLTRYGRLPVGTNGKAAYIKNGKPFMQRVKTWEPSRRYSVDEIAKAYGINLNTAARQPKRQRTGKAQGTVSNGLLEILESAGLYLEPIRGTAGGHRIICPWHAQHTNADTTGAAYWEPGESNGHRGGFKCQHGHCQQRTIADLDFFVQNLLRVSGAA